MVEHRKSDRTGNVVASPLCLDRSEYRHGALCPAAELLHEGAREAAVLEGLGRKRGRGRRGAWLEGVEGGRGGMGCSHQGEGTALLSVAKQRAQPLSREEEMTLFVPP